MRQFVPAFNCLIRNYLRFREYLKKLHLIMFDEQLEQHRLLDDGKAAKFS